MRIAISQASGSSKYERYALWLRRVRGDIEVLDLAPLTPFEAIRAVRECSGLLLPGGEDIEPSRYGKREEVLLCESDPARDEQEFKVLEEALKCTIPILGICRGMQLINVFHGGTLVADIPLDAPDSITHRGRGSDVRHGVSIVRGSFLEKVVGALEGKVTSSHHQAVERVAQGLCISARAPDGVPEALEWVNPGEHSFLLGVQWHPERMEEGSLLSMPLARRFLLEGEQYACSK